ncbi:uncharacterized protein LOC105844560 [Hydra vulgaris]|uniref:uncharacterized protein LOC105844560 n=1 Tax=Hydra vulgaris TaxID=6087 RepID=UPI0032EA2317
MNITLYLAENNMAFRGSSDKLFTPQNGKFLGLIQMLAKFDPVMQKHLALAIKDDTSDHYCVSRWRILIDRVKILHLKKLCDTRWEAKISSVKAVRYQVGDVHDALIALSEIKGCNPETAHEAITLGEQLKDFSFLVSLIVWYDVLFQVNIVSKTLQEKDMDITQCAKLLKSCCSFLENYRKCGFKDAIIKAKDLAIELQVEPVFKPLKRIIRVKRHFDEPAQDGIYLFSPEKKLEIDFFNPLLDTSLISMRERFIQLENYSEVWGFSYNVDSLQKREEILKSYLALQSKLTVNLKSDINGILLCDELISIKPFLSKMVKDKITPIIVLNFIKQHKMQDLYPNTWIAMRILLTIPVTVSSGERSFSKMKLIKTYLRSTMSQDRLSSLGTLSIEKNIAENLDFSTLIKDFGDKKARKINLKN